MLVALTDAGFDVIDTAVTDHDGAMSVLLSSLEATAADGGDGE